MSYYFYAIFSFLVSKFPPLFLLQFLARKMYGSGNWAPTYRFNDVRGREM